MHGEMHLTMWTRAAHLIRRRSAPLAGTLRCAAEAGWSCRVMGSVRASVSEAHALSLHRFVQKTAVTLVQQAP